MPDDHSGFDFEVFEAAALSSTRRRELLGLFEATYRQPNHAFLDRSLSRLRHVALAYREGLPVGFGLVATRVMDLPRLPQQVVTLAGICCVAPEFRRQGLFLRLQARAASAAFIPEASRRLLCGRMAHPAALRSIGRVPGALPQPGKAPTAWQQEVAAAIADAYGVYDFDARTFVCIGDGRPIGYPQIEIEVQPHEWDVFESVNRDRGDSLLAMAWAPDGPPGWERARASGP